MKKVLAIIGGGAAGIMLGCMLDPAIYDIHLYEQKRTLGRKLMVAGKGGFNLTHGSDIHQMINQYHPRDFMAPILSGFTNVDLRKFFKSIGIPTYIGSSNRVFPRKGIKPVQVLKALLSKLKENEITIHYNTRWDGFGESNCLKFSNKDNSFEIQPDFAVFSLGGGSWKKTGSDGRWLPYFEALNIQTIEFRPSNCGVIIDWPSSFLDKWEGHPIKNIVVMCGDVYVAGEALITKYGLEGGAIYALSRMINQEVDEKGYAEIYIDLKPAISGKRWKSFKIRTQKKKSVTENLKNNLKLERVKIALIKALTEREDFMNPKILSTLIKNFKLTVTGLSDIDVAISTTGGISLEELDEHLQLKSLKSHYAIGEMLNWDAPTGGYLLQACFSMGARVAIHLNEKGRHESYRPSI